MHHLFKKKQPFFIGFDSDGCVFNTMELKQKEIFIPQAIETLGLGDIADRFQSIAEEINLYSMSRGCNRFIALASALQQLRETPSLRRKVPDPALLLEFINSGRALSNESFAAYIGDEGSPFLRSILHWSNESNRRIAERVKNEKPFPFARESLQKAATFANTMVISTTPAPALYQEWRSAGIIEFIDSVSGQEFGSKTDQLAAALAAGFDKKKALMVGDSPGDHEAARDKGICFFPITPGMEEASWRELYEQGLSRLREGSFIGAYQESILADYYLLLDRQH